MFSDICRPDLHLKHTFPLQGAPTNQGDAGCKALEVLNYWTHSTSLSLNGFK